MCYSDPDVEFLTDRFCVALISRSNDSLLLTRRPNAEQMCYCVFMMNCTRYGVLLLLRCNSPSDKKCESKPTLRRYLSTEIEPANVIARRGQTGKHWGVCWSLRRLWTKLLFHWIWEPGSVLGMEACLSRPPWFLVSSSALYWTLLSQSVKSTTAVDKKRNYGCIRGLRL